jgi:hypothetical protein
MRFVGEKNIIYIAGPEIPCSRCIKTAEIVKKVILSLNLSESTEIQHILLYSKPTIEKYGRLRSPAVIFNDVVVSEGEIPNENHIQNAAKQLLIPNKG